MAIANTLTPEVLYEIALIAKTNSLDNITKPENLLDEIVSDQKYIEDLCKFYETYFNSRKTVLFLALYRFLKDNNYLPEIPDEQINKEEDFDSITLDYMMEERNW